MLRRVDVGRLPLSAYRGVAPGRILDALEETGRRLRGIRVLHVNATPYGGGVSELLRSAVPLYNDLGLVADWRIISGDEPFFAVTKRLHNALQGADDDLNAHDRAVYERYADQNAAAMEEEYDIVVVHDPQPLAIPTMRGAGAAHWVWRCHIDTSAPNPAVWEFLRGFLAPFEAAVFTMAEFVPPSAPVGRVEIMPPAIDPLSPKNMELPRDSASAVLNWIGVEPDRPLVTQISRFDPWKDPLGVIDAYRMARRDVPGLQLALAGSMALDDPEGWGIYDQIRRASEMDEDIHLFTNLTGVGNVEVNAFQRLSDLVVQKSIREGFGLVVSEALWKQTAVVAGRAGGIPLQMADGVGGVLVDSVEGCAQAMVELLKSPERARELAAAGQARVRDHFLLPRLLLDELTLFADLLQAGPRRERPHLGAERDPVCGMTVTNVPQELTVVHEARRFVFCSQQCRGRFVRAPRHYLHDVERRRTAGMVEGDSG